MGNCVKDKRPGEQVFACHAVNESFLDTALMPRLSHTKSSEIFSEKIILYINKISIHCCYP